jgi:hypothetical protein
MTISLYIDADKYSVKCEAKIDNQVIFHIFGTFDKYCRLYLREFRKPINIDPSQYAFLDFQVLCTLIQYLFDTKKLKADDVICLDAGQNADPSLLEYYADVLGLHAVPHSMLYNYFMVYVERFLDHCSSAPIQIYEFVMEEEPIYFLNDQNDFSDEDLFMLE